MMLEFPIPAKPWSTNKSGQMHWRTRYDHIQAWKMGTFAAARNRWRTDASVPWPANIQVEIPFPRGARRDPHNYVGTVCKAIVDGLVKAGCWPDDTAEYVTVIEPLLVVTTPPLTVKVHITPRDDGLA